MANMILNMPVTRVAIYFETSPSFRKILTFKIVYIYQHNKYIPFTLITIFWSLRSKDFSFRLSNFDFIITIFERNICQIYRTKAMETNKIKKSLAMISSFIE